MKEATTNYPYEHLFVGDLGNVLIIVSFVSVLLATVSWFFAASGKADSLNEDENKAAWRALGRVAFNIHTVTLIGAIGTLFAMIIGRYFEYHYVWHHSNSEMQLKYVFSCFWEGQEGSFLLWAFWHAVLGQILFRTAKSFESPVMAVYSGVQAFLLTMVLGVVVLDYKVGSNPFTILLREHPDFARMPMFKSPDYNLSPMFDGRGLNPLLQNYWMTIHPPTLFLGFAATLVPFAYAIAALWKERYTEWLRPCLPWAFFGVAVLGTGILMGGAWAYEALSFGGFWAWDPVENASLVPWLTLVGAAHLMLISKNRGSSVVFAFALSILSFVLILYSTFLTRSGILGDASVHAFTDLGMSGQLLVYLLSFLFLGLGLMLARWKRYPKPPGDEAFLSRDFWMLIGAVVLLISAVQVSSTTSIPVYNKVFGQSLAMPSDMVGHFHRWQVPLAILLGLLVGATQFMKYKRTQSSKFFKDVALSLVVTTALTVAVAIGMGFQNAYYIALLWSSMFAVVGNFDYLLRIMKGKVGKAGASIAHVGFGLLLLGALISTGQSEIISVNRSLSDLTSLNEDLDNREHVLLYKNDTVRMGDYMVSYRGRKKVGINIKFEVEYMTMEADGSFEHQFSLFPRVQLNDRMGNAPEPDTRHYWNRDVFTHVSWGKLSDPAEEEARIGQWEEPTVKGISMGDTLFARSAFLILDSIRSEIGGPTPDSTTSVLITAMVDVVDENGDTKRIEPTLFLPAMGNSEARQVQLDDLGLRLTLQEVRPEANGFIFALEEKFQPNQEFIVMKAIVFPWINILWIGCLLLAIGSFIAVYNRMQLALRKKGAQ